MNPSSVYLTRPQKNLRVVSKKRFFKCGILLLDESIHWFLCGQRPPPNQDPAGAGH